VNASTPVITPVTTYADPIEFVVASTSVLEATGRIIYSVVLSYRGPTVDTIEGQSFRYPGTADLRLVRHGNKSHPFYSDFKSGKMAGVSIPLAYDGNTIPKVGDILLWEWEDLFNEAAKDSRLVAFADFVSKVEVSYLLLQAAKLIS
jgi:hypothetical protein